jgi:hypothetical protein
MSLFRNLFRSHKQEADAPARPRLPWLRCSQSATDVLGAHLQRIPGAAVWPRGDETGAFASGRSTPTLLPPPSPSSSGHEDPINTEPSRESSFRQNPAKSDGGESHYGSHYHLRPASVLERDPISSLSSESSRPSRLNRLDPARAKEAFNAMAARLSLRLRIPAEEPTTAEGKDSSHLTPSLILETSVLIILYSHPRERRRWQLLPAPTPVPWKASPGKIDHGVGKGLPGGTGALSKAAPNQDVCGPPPSSRADDFAPRHRGREARLSWRGGFRLVAFQLCTMPSTAA